MGLVAQIGAVVRRTRTGEEGFSIVEVLIAAFILVLGSLAIFMAFAAAVQNVQRSRDNQQAISVAQREMERVRAMASADFAEVGLSSSPEQFDGRVVGGGAEFDLARAEGMVDPQPLLVGGAIPSRTSDVQAADGTEFTVYRFVTCEPPVADPCAAKRVVVAVLPTAKANAAGYQQTYRELQTTVVSTETEP